MMYSFEGKSPRLLGKNIYISAQACVIGSVVIENNVCILPQAVIRADDDSIYISEGCNIQDGAILHTDRGIPMKIGKNVTVAHRVMMHGCTVDDDSVIGIGAIVLNHVVIGKHCMIGAGALILEHTIVPDGSLVLGSPGTIKRQLNSDEIEKLKFFSKHYQAMVPKYNKSLTVIVE